LIGGIADSGEYVPAMWRVVLIALVVGGAFVIGRVTAPGADRPGSADAARAAGVREGRALQVAPSSRAAFKDGYDAGANDVFGGYDGGWDYGRPYVITLRKGPDGITYAIASRRRPAGGR
jgi:uncharacterized membrane protein